MKMGKSIVFFIVLVCETGFFPRFILADDFAAAADTSHEMIKKADQSQRKDGGDEVILDEIEIKGKIEKPGLIILPKRIEPEMEEIELERSFKKEVKEGMGEIQKPDEATGKVEDIHSIKKAVKRKRQ
jgi:hypothetical protein